VEEVRKGVPGASVTVPDRRSVCFRLAGKLERAHDPGSIKFISPTAALKSARFSIHSHRNSRCQATAVTIWQTNCEYNCLQMEFEGVAVEVDDRRKTNVRNRVAATQRSGQGLRSSVERARVEEQIVHKDVAPAFRECFQFELASGDSGR
jgi:hypothetical protein